MKLTLALLTVLLLAPLAAWDAAAVQNPDSFAPLDAALLDKTTFAQSVSGKELLLSEAPQSVVWTLHNKPDWRGVKYGAGSYAGMRPLRIGAGLP